MHAIDFHRPYLVIPKLIEQNTWGGRYILTTKQWDSNESLGGHKIGQSYELFSGSNLSLLDSSMDPAFQGELTDRDAVQIATSPPHSFPLTRLVAQNPEAVLGTARSARAGGKVDLLIKFTQAMGNSFQVHIKDGTSHEFWMPKPESWYYLEPGLLTLGVKKNVDWNAYEAAMAAINEKVVELEALIAAGSIDIGKARIDLQRTIAEQDPTSYVNTIKVEKDQLVDLSGGGLHHSWEEDPVQYPLGNVLYELQLEAMDDVSTIRCFDKGKISSSGSARPMNIPAYFELIDRNVETNDPANHMLLPRQLADTDAYKLENLLKTKYYTLDKLSFTGKTGSYGEKIDEFKHVFVKSGLVKVSTSAHTVTVSVGHSCLVPASAKEYHIENIANESEILISY